MAVETHEYTAVCFGRKLWNVYRGEDFIGTIGQRVIQGTPEWFAHDSEEGHSQRLGRPSAYQAAKDMWGPEAADAVA